MKVVTIGRSSKNDVRIDDSLVSRHHLQIVQEDSGGYKLVDFGSKNGTYINGKKVHGEVRLSSSDVVRIGNTTLPWRTYFPASYTSLETGYQGTIDIEPEKPKHGKKRSGNDSEVDWHEVNEVKIDYNEGGFGRKFGQAAGDSAGNIVGCFIGILIVIILIAIIGAIMI